MSTYYHLTKAQHVPRILTEGLRPGHRVGLTVNVKRKVGKNFICPTLDDLLRVAVEHAGMKWMKRWDPVVLAVEVDDDEVEPVRYYSGGTYTISNFEYTCDKVPPQRIRYKGTVEEVLGLVMPELG